MIETNNTLENPTGPEWQFLVGEGMRELDAPSPWPHPVGFDKSEADMTSPAPQEPMSSKKT